jgi:hypothetical protein
VIAGAYPIMPFAAMALFVAWTAFATLRFSFALPALIALVPAVGFATWTGWLTVEEVDLLVLASCAGGYAAIAIGLSTPDAGEPRHRPKLSIFAIALLGLFFASTVIALVRGIDAAGGLRLDLFDWSAGYDSAQNSLRIFKSFAFALLIAPLLIGELRKPGGFDRFGAGMTIALGLGTLIVLQERLAFVGLLDFSQDYRVTGGFWEMHVGGAALDGFLALTLPFAIREALRHPSHARFVGAGIVLALATYACLVTFSRGVYAAIPVSLAVLFVLFARQRLRFDRGAVWVLLAKAFVFAVVIAICGSIVFRNGGYRAVLASFIVLAAAIPVDAALRRLNLSAAVAAVIAALVLAAGGLLVASVLPKGPYLIFALAFFATAAAVLHAERSTLPSSGAYVVGSWLWLAAAAADVARFWGGSVALHDSAVMLSGFVVLVLAASRLPKSIWPQCAARALDRWHRSSAWAARLVVRRRPGSFPGDIAVRVQRRHATRGLRDRSSQRRNLPRALRHADALHRFRRVVPRISTGRGPTEHDVRRLRDGADRHADQPAHRVVRETVALRQRLPRQRPERAARQESMA